MPNHPIRLVIFACGNPARGDDGLGPALLQRLRDAKARRGDWGRIELVEDFQLQIEHAADLKARSLALFLDACVDCPPPYRFSAVAPAAGPGHLSHALAPGEVLYVFAKAYASAPPPAYALGIRGERFALGESLGAGARERLDAAYDFVLELLGDPSPLAWARMAARGESPAGRR